MKVYFELFGKKMVTEVDTRDPAIAKEVIKSKIIFHKLEQTPIPPKKDIFNDFDELFGSFKKK